MSNEKFKGCYEIDDGYVGGARPQYFSFYSGDIEEDMTDEELVTAYEEAAEEHFREHCSISPRRAQDFVQWAKEQLAIRAKEQS